MITKQNSVVMLFIILLFLIFLIAGCGTIDVNLHTTVKPSGDLFQEIQIQGSGMMGNYISNSELIESYREEDWQTEIKKSDDVVSLIATKNIDSKEITSVLNSTQDNGEIWLPGELKINNFEIHNSILTKEYLLDIDIPGSSTEDLSNETEDEFSELGTVFDETMEELVKNMFSMSWTITLPGKIIETNADNIEENSATWYFDINSLNEGRHIMIRTRYVNWLVVGILIAVVLATIVSVVVFLLVRKRRSKLKAP